MAGLHALDPALQAVGQAIKARLEKPGPRAPAQQLDGMQILAFAIRLVAFAPADPVPFLGPGHRGPEAERGQAKPAPEQRRAGLAAHADIRGSAAADRLEREMLAAPLAMGEIV